MLLQAVGGGGGGGSLTLKYDWFIYLIALQCIFYYTILVSVTMFCHQIKNKLFCPQNTLTIPRSLGRKSFLHGRLVTNG